jgi:hypothetical protein
MAGGAKRVFSRKLLPYKGSFFYDEARVCSMVTQKRLIMKKSLPHCVAFVLLALPGILFGVEREYTTNIGGMRYAKKTCEALCREKGCSWTGDYHPNTCRCRCDN